MDKSLVITGSGGILGSAILKILSEETDFQVYAVTSQVQKVMKAYESNENIQVYSSIKEIPEDKKKIAINCAFPRLNKGKELATAFEYTENLIDQLARKSCEFFVNISSQSVYAQTGKTIQTESSPVEPSNLYGMTKYAIERLVEVKSQQYDIDYTKIRLGSLASSTFDQRMINRFYYKIKNNEAITVDSGEPKVSYLHVQDAAKALVHYIQNINNRGKTSHLYNLANNDWMTIQELVKLCIQYGEKIGLGSSQLLFSDKVSEYNNVIDSTLFIKEVNWEPEYSMEDLVQNIYDLKLKYDK